MSTVPCLLVNRILCVGAWVTIISLEVGCWVVVMELLKAESYPNNLHPMSDVPSIAYHCLQAYSIVYRGVAYACSRSRCWAGCRDLLKRGALRKILASNAAVLRIAACKPFR